MDTKKEQRPRCQNGYDVLIDQHIAAPEDGWPLWMNNGIDDADFVLRVCTETYKRRVMGKEKKDWALVAGLKAR